MTSSRTDSARERSPLTPTRHVRQPWPARRATHRLAPHPGTRTATAPQVCDVLAGKRWTTGSGLLTVDVVDPGAL